MRAALALGPVFARNRVGTVVALVHGMTRTSNLLLLALSVLALGAGGCASRISIAPSTLPRALNAAHGHTVTVPRLGGGEAVLEGGYTAVAVLTTGQHLAIDPRATASIRPGTDASDPGSLDIHYADLGFDQWNLRLSDVDHVELRRPHGGMDGGVVAALVALGVVVAGALIAGLVIATEQSLSHGFGGGGCGILGCGSWAI